MRLLILLILLILMILLILLIVTTRAKRVGFFKFGSGRVRVLEKTSGSGIGTVFFIG